MMPISYPLSRYCMFKPYPSGIPFSQDALQWVEQLPVTEQYDALEQIGQQVEHYYIRLGDVAEAFMSYFHNSMAWHGMLTPKVVSIPWEPRGQCEETPCPER